MKKVPLAWEPAKYDLADLTAVKAVAKGEASAGQQQRALKWVIEELAGTYDLGWHPNGDRESSFVAGRRFVGLQIVKALTVDVTKLKRDEDG